MAEPCGTCSADPGRVLDRDGVTTRVEARPVSGEEFDRYWTRFTEIWPPYDAYRAPSGRDIAMFVLTEA